LSLRWLVAAAARSSPPHDWNSPKLLPAFSGNAGASKLRAEARQMSASARSDVNERRAAARSIAAE